MNSSGQQLNILFTCIGRRVSLLRAFRRAVEVLGLTSRINAAERTPLSSAFQLCDGKYIVKAVNDPDYIQQILDIVKSESVHLLIPTVDLDLKLLSQHKNQFEQLGCKVLISAPDVVDICQDKRKTFQVLKDKGFSTPLTLSYQDAVNSEHLPFPCFLKPWDGYASRGSYVVNDKEELAFYAKRVPNCIVQNFIVGTEFTCDVFVDFEMNVRCVVPRKRIEVRSGEVSKSQVIKDPDIMKTVASVVQSIGAGPGVITVQLIKNGNGSINIIEINPRFGGGAPLSIQAGADFPGWILQQIIGKQPTIGFDNVCDGLTMLRYDAEVWLEPGNM